MERLENQVQSNQSKLSMILGALIILVLGILVFNYFNRDRGADLGPAQKTQTQQEEDVSPKNLPGKYTVKEGDTLFLIAEKYYKDGYKYPDIAKENNIGNVDSLEVGQVLQIPKLELAQATPSPSPEGTADPTEEPLGTGGADTTIWGPRITQDSYTVVEGDWLSKIAGRAYGDIFAYPKIAQANNIDNPDLIHPGTVLTIPR